MLDEVKKDVVWEFYFESSFQARYFGKQVSLIRKKITFFGILIAVCGLVPLLNVVGQYWDNQSISLVFGVISALSGIYLSTSNLVNKLSISIRASDEWNEASVRSKHLWERCLNGEDTYKKVMDMDERMLKIDTIVNQFLDDNPKLSLLAWKETETVLS